jgi:IS5 family transposase
MIQARRLQRRFAEGLIAEEIGDLREPWMTHSDAALNDNQLLEIVQQALSRRCTKSKTRGRPATTAEVVVRMLLLKHIYNWSYQDLTREVRANLVYRDFTGIGAGKVPDDKTMGRLGRQLGPEVVEKIWPNASVTPRAGRNTLGDHRQTGDRSVRAGSLRVETRHLIARW